MSELTTKEYEILDLSKSKFKRCKTVKEFLSLWSQFYDNQIWIPGYCSYFVGSRDNPQATLEIGKKFKDITSKGVICLDSQVTIPLKQKGYIEAYVPTNIVRKLTKQLNFYDNIVAFNYDISHVRKHEGARDTFVTFQTGADGSVESCTHVSEMSDFEMTIIHEWINRDLRALMNVDTYSQLVIINPNFESPPEYVIDVLLEVVHKLL